MKTHAEKRIAIQKQITEFSWPDALNGINHLYSEILKGKFHPEIIIGISRGGLIPATILSYKLGIPLGVISIQTYTDDHKSGVLKINTTISSVADLSNIENALIVDDIADSGETLGIAFTEVKRKIPNIKLATLHYKKSSIMQPDIFYKEVKDSTWTNYPWE